MAKSIDDRRRGARPARRDEGAYCWYVTEEQRSRPGWIGGESDQLSHSRALTCTHGLASGSAALPVTGGSLPWRKQILRDLEHAVGAVARLRVNDFARPIRVRVERKLIRKFVIGFAITILGIQLLKSVFTGNEQWALLLLFPGPVFGLANLKKYKPGL